MAVVCAVPLLLLALTAGGPLTSTASSQTPAPPPPDPAAAPPAPADTATPAEPEPAAPPPEPAPQPEPVEEPAPPPEESTEAPAAVLVPEPPPAAPPAEPAPTKDEAPSDEPVDDAAPGPREPVVRRREAPGLGVGGPPPDEEPVDESVSDDETDPPEEPEPDEDPAFWEELELEDRLYEESDPSGWRFWRRIPNLTGALGLVGAGGKESGSIGPSLSSLRAPVSPAELAILGELLPVDDSAEAPGQPAPDPSPSGAPPETAPTPPSGNLRGQERRIREIFQPSGGGDASGLPGAPGVPGDPSGAATPGGGDTAGAAGAAPIVPAPAAGAEIDDPVGQAQGGGEGSAANPDESIRRTDRDGDGEVEETIVRPVERFVEKVPNSLKYALAALGALSLMLGIGYLFAALRARSLARQRRDLLQEVGLLQSALLPPVPEKLGALRTSVAYRPADGPGAGGDFYDVLPLAGGSVGFILGDVSGHGRGALARTAFMRYTLRAYLEAGLEPRAALKVAGRVIDENLGGDFATVLLAVHDPETGSLTYATAGHPAPIVVGPKVHHPVTAGSSPPIGVGIPTGLRQTTVPLVSGSVACLFTDGLMEARSDGGILGRDRLEGMLAEMGDDATARGLIERVAQDARVLSDDIAAVVVSPVDGVAPTAPRTEQLELSPRELEGPIARRFLDACGVSEADTAAAVAQARSLGSGDGAVLNVMYGEHPHVEVLPRDVEGIEAASHRTAGTR